VVQQQAQHVLRIARPPHNLCGMAAGRRLGSQRRGARRGLAVSEERQEWLQASLGETAATSGERRQPLKGAVCRGPMQQLPCAIPHRSWQQRRRGGLPRA
jgi:hypothetical protein